MRQITKTERRALWSERLARFQSADLTVAEFCRRESISAPSFYLWKKRLDPDPANKPRSRAESANRAKFVPIHVNAMMIATKLTLPGGATVELPIEQSRGKTVDLIAAVIEASELHENRKENA